jgi:hypothetical protein
LRAGSAIHGAGGGSFFPHEAAVLAAADAREPLVERFFGRLVDHPDREMRYLAADQLQATIDREYKAMKGVLVDLGLAKP